MNIFILRSDVHILTFFHIKQRQQAFFLKTSCNDANHHTVSQRSTLHTIFCTSANFDVPLHTDQCISIAYTVAELQPKPILNIINAEINLKN